MKNLSKRLLPDAEERSLLAVVVECLRLLDIATAKLTHPDHTMLMDEYQTLERAIVAARLKSDVALSALRTARKARADKETSNM